jgi:hypothetical protein
LNHFRTVVRRQAIQDIENALETGQALSPEEWRIVGRIGMRYVEQYKALQRMKAGRPWWSKIRAWWRGFPA